jgi:hypothetical protein
MQKCSFGAARRNGDSDWAAMQIGGSGVSAELTMC